MSAPARRAAPLYTTYNLVPGLSGIPERFRGKRLIMASAFEVYIDDSGSEPSSPIFFLGGFLSTVERWAAFSNEWDSALSLPPSLDYFKMSEAAGFWEQFSRKRGWDEEKRNDRLVTLARIINKYAMLRVSTSIRHDLFAKYVLSLPAIERNLSTDEPHVILALHLISATLFKAREMGIREPIDFIFDKQNGYEAEFRRIWPQCKRTFQLSSIGREVVGLIGDDPNFLDEKQRLPLQAADLYAWQVRGHYMDNHRFPNQEIIAPMTPTLKLLRGIPKEHAPMNEGHLKTQYDGLTRTGEQLKKENPSLQLTFAGKDRKERRRMRRKSKSQMRQKRGFS